MELRLCCQLYNLRPSAMKYFFVFLTSCCLKLTSQFASEQVRFSSVQQICNFSEGVEESGLSLRVHGTPFYACNRWVVHGARDRIAPLESEKVLVQIFFEVCCEEKLVDLDGFYLNVAHKIYQRSY